MIPSLPVTIWLAVDFVAACIAFLLGTAIRFGGDFAAATVSVGNLTPRILLFACCVVAGYFVTGMYRLRQRVVASDVIARSIVALSFAGILSILIYYVYPPVETGRGVLALGILVSMVSLTTGRFLSASFIDSRAARKRVVVVGAGVAARKIAMRRRRSDCRRYEIIGYVPTTGDIPLPAGDTLLPVIGSLDALKDLHFDELVLALDDRRHALEMTRLLDFKLNGACIRPVVDFLERETGQIEIDVVDQAWFVFNDGCHTRLPYLLTKRAFDLSVGVALLVLLSPVLLLVCVALLIESRGRDSILYRQMRVGLQGKTFELLKFRSMQSDAEVDGKPRWAKRDDSRVTTVGKVLRRIRVDELPQLINVLRGDMHIVGPRPERPEFVQELSRTIPMFQYRHCVKPGLAGWAQLSFPYGSSVSDAR